MILSDFIFQDVRNGLSACNGREISSLGTSQGGFNRNSWVDYASMRSSWEPVINT